MRENRPYGSEGGVGASRSRPLSVTTGFGAVLQSQARGYWIARSSRAMTRNLKHLFLAVSLEPCIGDAAPSMMQGPLGSQIVRLRSVKIGGGVNG